MEVKKIILLAVVLGGFCVNALACQLTFYVDSTEKSSIVFTIISPDNQYQNTMRIDPGASNSFINLTCQSYNIYAQNLNANGVLKKSPYGDYVYMYNSLQLTGNLPVFFPKDFKLDPLP